MSSKVRHAIAGTDDTKMIALSASAVSGMSHTGDTSETVLASFVIPANTLKAGDILNIRTLSGDDLSVAAADNFRVRIGNHATLGSNNSIVSWASATAKSNAREMDLCITSQTTAAYYNWADQDAAGSASTAIATFSANFDTTVDNTVYFTVTLANAANTATLHSYTLTLIKGD